jgi:endonuclease/exonuclease/phosphatase family metal-dependent hydrolase
MMTWNIKSGGFNRYDLWAMQPEREQIIKQIVDERHMQEGVSAVTLVDAYRWDEVYGGQQGIADHLGYKEARFTRLEDDRLIRNKGAGIGIAFATDEKIAASTILDLESRNALGVILDAGRHGLQIAGVYLDDLDEDVRLKQVNALCSQLEPDVPTVLTGDFNALRATLHGAALRHRLGDMAVRMLARTLPRSSELGKAVSGMNRREVVPQIERLGFSEAHAGKQPTALGRLMIFGVDYAFHNERVTIENFNVLSGAQARCASDHRPILFDVQPKSVPGSL